ncbi:hypothetical protein [Providencia sp. PROV123]|uniref:hypothetical protein n=1 Tax=Providencia sp. PROV123 TaxID=2949834 RepID=UPI00234B3AF4|nr:hypothetical protein [Providencia sp. PROV123]
MSKTTDQLVRIAAAGGGITIKASDKTTDQLVRIAAAMASSSHQNKPTLTLYEANTKTTDQLVRIASAGRGCVNFVL